MTDFFETLVACDPEPVSRTSRGRARISQPSNEAPKTDTPACNLTMLALDLGTTTGWALAPRGGAVRSGSFRLDPSKLGGNGRRWIAFREWLTATAREAGGVQAVYVEDVRRHVSNLSARVYCGYLAMLEAWCAANNIPLHGVGVGTIKKHATGKGNADKGAMIAAARKRGVQVTDDNEADAVALLGYAIEQEA